LTCDRLPNNLSEACIITLHTKTNPTLVERCGLQQHISSNISWSLGRYNNSPYKKLIPHWWRDVAYNNIWALIYHDPYANGGSHKGVVPPTSIIVDWLQCEYHCCLAFHPPLVQNIKKILLLVLHCTPSTHLPKKWPLLSQICLKCVHLGIGWEMWPTKTYKLQYTMILRPMEAMRRECCHT